ncbi:hypothetical protein VNO77_00001 [Canavalia gladiata]|uniref:Uncharacterized protein n=1 Tax=Canavalia gladiata TaxID=3824 RepID=A0AAN9MNI3_CANGL
MYITVDSLIELTVKLQVSNCKSEVRFSTVRSAHSSRFRIPSFHPPYKAYHMKSPLDKKVGKGELENMCICN